MRWQAHWLICPFSQNENQYEITCASHCRLLLSGLQNFLWYDIQCDGARTAVGPKNSRIFHILLDLMTTFLNNFVVDNIHKFNQIRTPIWLNLANSSEYVIPCSSLYLLLLFYLYTACKRPQYTCEFGNPVINLVFQIPMEFSSKFKVFKLNSNQALNIKFIGNYKNTMANNDENRSRKFALNQVILSLNFT